MYVCPQMSRYEYIEIYIYIYIYRSTNNTMANASEHGFLKDKKIVRTPHVLMVL